MRIDVVTIFPDYLAPLRHALLGKAIENNLLQIGVHDLRQWTYDVHKAVDGPPCGGGPGMVMKPEVWGPALDDVAAGTGPVAQSEKLTSASPHKNKKVVLSAEQGECASKTKAGATASERPLLIVPTPAGIPFTQEMAARWSQRQHLVFACGRYEGIDQRVVEDASQRYDVEEVSIGDYVLIGGEVATLVMVEATVRLIPGVLGNRSSHEEDSFQDGLLEGPCYTKPRTWREHKVPDVLFSGDHAKVARWRREQALARTADRRPDLIENLRAAGGLSRADEAFLASYSG